MRFNPGAAAAEVRTLGNSKGRIGMDRIEQGHCIFDGVFTPTEMRALLGNLSTADMERTKAGARRLLCLSEVRRRASDVRMLKLAGGFIGLGPLIVHASSKVTPGQRRRVLHIEYALRLSRAQASSSPLPSVHLQSERTRLSRPTFRRR